jgi:hypothetical protein
MSACLLGAAHRAGLFGGRRWTYSAAACVGAIASRIARLTTISTMTFIVDRHLDETPP